jgi:class 3 adenylate cyclase
VGGKAKSQFDVIGDCVNGAARLQEYTKFFEKSLLLTEEVVQELHDEEILRDMFQLLDTVNIRGQGERRIYCTR